MTETKIELRKRTAAEGMILTNGKAYSEDGVVILGCNDSSDNWYEITKEEYDEILKEKASQEEEINEDIY